MPTEQEIQQFMMGLTLAQTRGVMALCIDNLPELDIIEVLDDNLEQATKKELVAKWNESEGGQIVGVAQRFTSPMQAGIFIPRNPEKAVVIGPGFVAHGCCMKFLSEVTTNGHLMLGMRTHCPTCGTFAELTENSKHFAWLKVIESEEGPTDANTP